MKSEAAGHAASEAREVTKVLNEPAREQDSAAAATEPTVVFPENSVASANPPASKSDGVPEIKAVPDLDKGVAPEVLATDVVAKTQSPIGSAVIPFVAKPGENPSEPPRVEASRFHLLQSRGMQAALVAAFVGLGWAVAGSFFGAHTLKAPVQQASQPVVTQVAATQEGTDTKRLTDEIHALKKELDTMRITMAQTANSEEVRALKRSVDTVKTGLESTKSEVSNSIAQLSGKLDRVQHEPAKLREISDRLDHIEHPAAVPLVTASLPPQKEEAVKPPQVPLPPAKAATQTQAQGSIAAVAPQAQSAVVKPSSASVPPAATDKPQLLTNWVVRDVYHGIALVEGPHGSIEVIPGETIPGAGTVKSIEKRGNGWIVLTSRGLVDSAR
jgi:hypothetical protein